MQNKSNKDISPMNRKIVFQKHCEKISESNKKRYSNPKECEILHQYHLSKWDNKKKNSYLFIKDGVTFEFDCLKTMMKFLYEEYGWNPPIKTVKKIFHDSFNGIPYQPFPKNKFSKMEGIFMFEKLLDV